MKEMLSKISLVGNWKLQNKKENTFPIIVIKTF